MLYDQPLVVECSLLPSVALERIREMVNSRQMIEAPRFRRRQILGWRFREQGDGVSLAPEYGDSASAYGTRFEGRVEAYGSGSRVAGRVILSRLSRFIMSVWFTFVVIAAFFALRQGAQSAFRIVTMAAVMIAGGVLLVLYSLRSTRALVEAGLSAALGSAGADPSSRSLP